MTYEEYAKVFIKKYELNLQYKRASGDNLFYKKILIYILRERFRLGF